MMYLHRATFQALSPLQGSHAQPNHALPGSVRPDHAALLRPTFPFAKARGKRSAAEVSSLVLQEASKAQRRPV